MSLNTDIEPEFGWYMPTRGDGPYIGVQSERVVDSAYNIKVAQAVEEAGYTFALIPTGGDCFDAWLVGATLAAHTKIFKPLVAMRPGLIAPALAARMGATLDEVTGGRALINIVTGSSPADMKAMGDVLAFDKDARYERTLEYVKIVKQLWINSTTKQGNKLLAAHEPFKHITPYDHKGKYFQLEGGISYPPPIQRPHPPFYFGGSSPAAKKTAAEIADVYLMWAEPLDWIKEQIAEVEHHRQELRESQGVDRFIRYGLRAQVVIRDTEEDAWEAANRIVSRIDPVLKQGFEGQLFYNLSAGQQRQTELKKLAEANHFVIGPNFWAGLAQVRGGGAMAFVGTPDQVADRLLEYVDIGVTSFILSGYPNLEEATISGKALLPVFKRKWLERKLERKSEHKQENKLENKTISSTEITFS
ncbi:LLM class flavin-dependent oxidoreductase [Paenibacillus sp. GSMTC-2017]|uniref:LLM class flavin-dependent oxidoreductase n=1 Tax=Paenibacillus sp. GSMTC-2017 TaxID=2794350 RepID=UPI0018D9F13B|nr:LLM class flavin-dependent oxidoreductase [Paenibacillus sp. GSMTC-2017]MBH5317410.1 LLM class flavin-dependent oxidoreductase [Paenibacillus sp. GSMTC-2017]